MSDFVTHKFLDSITTAIIAAVKTMTDPLHERIRELELIAGVRNPDGSWHAAPGEMGKAAAAKHAADMSTRSTDRVRSLVEQRLRDTGEKRP